MDKKPSPAEALKVIDEAVSLLTLNRGQHVLLVNCVTVLQEVVNAGSDTKIAPPRAVGKAKGS